MSHFSTIKTQLKEVKPLIKALNQLGYSINQEKIENMVAAQVDAVKNMKIDKVTVWDGGNNPDGSSATSNFVSSLVQSLPPIHDVAKMSGVELPDYLGTMSDEKSSKE